MKCLVREEPYRITGATRGEIARAIAILGPMRGGVRFAAFTDWEVVYRVRAGAPPPSVEVRAVVRLPDLVAPLSATADLREAFARYVDALRRHEGGHVAIAESAGHAVREALSALPESAGPRDVDRAARTAIASAHARERAYDLETSHGATQGASLWPPRQPPSLVATTDPSLPEPSHGATTDPHDCHLRFTTFGRTGH